MNSKMRHLAAAVALVLSLAALTGSALAAPPGEPPGQAKKAEEAQTPAQQPAPAPAKGKATAPGQQKKSSTAGSQSKTKSKGIHSTTSGVKPGKDTDKNTSCRTGGGTGSSATCGPGPQPDNSKRYGHGGTAAQIANSRGAPAGTEIRGPGNSQPHKVCKKINRGGKEVWADVHSVKLYPTCVPAQQQAAPTSQPSVTVTPSAGGVAGVSVTQQQPAKGEEAGGVLGAFGQLGKVTAGKLPFTGLPLWAVVLIALVAIAVGSVLWRQGRTARDVV